MKLADLFSVSPKPIQKTSLREGGNVFAGKTAPIKMENITPTLDAYFAELKKIFPKKSDIFNEEHFHAVGSVRKKPESGDIDLAVSVEDILDKNMSAESIELWNIDPQAVDAEADALQKRARSSTPEQSRMKAFLKLLAVYINNNASNLYCDEKKVTDGNIFGLFPQIDEMGDEVGIGVQIDWMIGNLKWLKFSYYSAALPKGSNAKGLHRTQMILAAFQVADLSFNHISGVKDKSTGEVLATDPDDALKILGDRLGFAITQDDAENYYKLHDLFKAKMRPEDYDRLLDIYFKILDSTRADVPDNIQAEWRARKNNLGLTGKFLPDGSKLKEPESLEESGVAGADRIRSRADFAHFLQDYHKLISQFPGFVSMTPSGSYNSNPDKKDFGDIDLVVHIQTDRDKPSLKKELQAWFHKQPDTVIVPFSSAKYAGKRSYNSGEIVTVRYHDVGVGYSAQIDNIIALNPLEADFKQKFLDLAAPKQGLILGLVKVATIETAPSKLFKHMGIDIAKLDPAGLGEDQEYEFNLSSNDLQLRKVTYETGGYKQKGREILWHSQDMGKLKKLLYQYNLSADFSGLLRQVKEKIKNPRSSNRIIGVFNSMISVKSGEVGTAKGEEKEDASRMVSSTLSENKALNFQDYFSWLFENEDGRAKTVVIMPGRFQPFHKAHAETYKNLQKRFPDADVWIATTGKVGPSSPFDFEERKALAELMGVPADRIAAVKSPYIASEILAHYDPSKDHVIFALGAKDAGRIEFVTKRDGSPTYLQPYHEGEDMAPFDTKSGHAYVTVAPVISFKIAGKTLTGATDIREMLSQGDSTLTDRVLEDLYGPQVAAASEIVLKHFPVK